MFKRFLEKRSERKHEEELAIAKRREAFAESLLNPEFEEIERVFGRPVSNSLRSLYENRTEIQRENVTKIIPGQPEDQWIWLIHYFPLDKAQAEGGWNPDGVHFAFAGTGDGNEWVVDPTEDDAEIKFLQHETCEYFPTGVKMSEYLELAEPSKDS